MTNRDGWSDQRTPSVPATENDAEIEHVRERMATEATRKAARRSVASLRVARGNAMSIGQRALAAAHARPSARYPRGGQRSAQEWATTGTSPSSASFATSRSRAALRQGCGSSLDQTILFAAMRR